MVMFASLIGAAAIYARVASAVPMDYDSSSGNYGSSSASGYGNSKYGSGDNSNYGSSGSSSWSMPSSTAAYPASTSSSSASSYGSGSSGYGSGSSGYGSGSSNWNSGGYDNCVQQCVAQYGSPSSMYMPPSSTSNPGSGSSGSGATHTVIVAPTQGVLRYIPFALNASVGDTVMFMWGANNHTVTKSSEISVCNKTSDDPFASGEQNKGFSFSQVVNDTNPVFYYCGTPTHCEKGMFGIINPPNAYQQPSSASNMMASLASQNPSTQAAWSYASNVTANNSAAGNWGMNIDMSGMPAEYQPYVAENIMYTQSYLAMNPETISTNGTVDLGPLSGNSVMIPTDVAAAARQNNAESGTPSSSSSSSSSTASSAPSGTPSSSGALSNGAGVLASPRVAVALVAVVAAFFAL